jgi:hypothetical protein
MRIAYLLFLVPAIFSGGCAAMIARSGTDPTYLKTKEEIHANFGEPIMSGKLDGMDGAFYEDYFTRRKIATEYPNAEGEVMCFAMTLGTLEVLLVSQELYLTTKRAIAGQTLRFTYDKDAKLINVQMDGRSEEFMRFNLRDRVVQNTSPYPVVTDPLPLPSMPPLP